MDEIFIMNNWTWQGLLAGFAFGFWAGMVVADLINTCIRKRR